MGNALIAKSPAAPSSNAMEHVLISRTDLPTSLTYKFSGSYNGNESIDIVEKTDSISKDSIISDGFIMIYLFTRYQFTNITHNVPTSYLSAFDSSSPEMHYYTGSAYDRTYGISNTVRQFVYFPILSISTGSWKYSYTTPKAGEYDGPIEIDIKISVDLYFNRAFNTSNSTFTATTTNSFIELWGIRFH